MLRSMDAAVAGLRAHQNKLDVISNNIANVNTFGFKSQTYSFKEAMYQTSTDSTGGSATTGGINASQYGYGSMMGSIITDMSASTPTYVGGLNATINGEGFFISSAKNAGSVETDKFTGSGDLTYTRVGQFKIDSNGYLTDANGYFIYGFQPDGNGGIKTSELVPIRVATDMSNVGVPTFNYDATKEAKIATNVSINELGEVTANLPYTDANGVEKTANVSLGKIAIATFQNPEGLTKKGEFYYTSKDGDNSGKASANPAGEGSASKLMSGYLEASNVDLSQQFADMITTQRGFQANAKIITVSDEILQEMVNMKR